MKTNNKLNTEKPLIGVEDIFELTQVNKRIKALSFFTFMDRSSEESIKINLRLSITTKNWDEKKELFIQERFSQRSCNKCTFAEWAKIEMKYLNSLEFEEFDRQILRDRYSTELLKISQIKNGIIKGSKNRWNTALSLIPPNTLRKVEVLLKDGTTTDGWFNEQWWIFGKNKYKRAAKNQVVAWRELVTDNK